jgi:hypothetical protein
MKKPVAVWPKRKESKAMAVAGTVMKPATASAAIALDKRRSITSIEKRDSQMLGHYSRD